MREEKQSFVDHGVFTTHRRPKGTPEIKGRWVLHINRDAAGEIERYKARFVAKGFAQRFGVNYDEVWAPTAHYSTLSLLFALAVRNDSDIRHVDATQTLYGS